MRNFWKKLNRKIMKKAYIKRVTTRLHKRFSLSLKKNDAKILLTVAISFLFCGCVNMFSAIYGVRQLDSFDEALCDKFTDSVERKGISLSTLVSDSLQFVEYWNLYPDSLWKKTASQPVQLLYFSGDTLVSYHVNCYAKGGLTSLNWNMDNRFGQFPPKTAVPLDNMRLKFRQIAQIYGLSLQKNCRLVIFYTNMLSRIAKDAVNTAFDNIEAFNKQRECEVVIINTDKFFLNVL